MGINQVCAPGSGKVYSQGLSDGSSSANAAPSALWIKMTTGTTTDGLYWIRPIGAASARQVWCDMNTSGGGWMLVARTHPSAAPVAGTWGWRSTTQVGSPTGYGAAYCMDFLNFWNDGFRFSQYIFGNQLSNNSNSWGPFIYQVSLGDVSTFMTSDTMQSGTNYDVLKSDSSIYSSPGFPGMHGAIGFSTTGTANNLFYMRDCCGFSTAYGIAPTGMNTAYCGSTTVVGYSGPWCNGATLSGNNWVQVGAASDVGGTNQCMLMVR